jgi:hypothetical protein
MDDFDLSASASVEMAPYGVAAVFRRELHDDPSRDGARYELSIADGNQTARILADLSGTQGGEQRRDVDRQAIENAVMYRAGSFATESRLDALVAAQPIVLRRDDLDR